MVQFLGITLMLTHTLPSAAKAYLVSAMPEENQTITKAPTHIELEFNETLRNEYLAASVVDSHGKRLDNRDAALNEKEKSKIQFNLQALTPDTYTVRYRVMGLDNLIVTGKYQFIVSLPEATEQKQTEPAIPTGKNKK